LTFICNIPKTTAPGTTPLVTISARESNCKPNCTLDLEQAGKKTVKKIEERCPGKTNKAAQIQTDFGKQISRQPNPSPYSGR
jgi:hypothetical protein